MRRLGPGIVVSKCLGAKDEGWKILERCMGP